MKAGTLCSGVLAVAVLISGCGPDIGFEDTEPFLVGDRGNLQFSAGGACGFEDRCSTESGGFYLDAEEQGLSTRVGVTANTVEISAMPQLEFESANPDVFIVRTTRCQTLMNAGSDMLEPCPVESPAVYSVELDLRSEGRADLVARLTSDGSVYDRGTVRVRPPLCGPDSMDHRCTD